MRSTAPFRRQHEELAAMGAEILLATGGDPEKVDVTSLRRSMARFLGKLKVHAAMENEALYPRLLAHETAEVQSTARTLFAEVEAIYASAWTYQERWGSAEAIDADVGAYLRDTRRLLKTLYARMERENRELYPLVERYEG